METKILASVNGTEYPETVIAVAAITNGFSVVGFDTDVEEFIPIGHKVFKTEAAAFDYAFEEIR